MATVDVLLDHGELHAPALLDVELASIFWSAHLRGDRARVG